MTFLRLFSLAVTLLLLGLVWAVVQILQPETNGVAPSMFSDEAIAPPALSSQANATRPNIIIILADDLGYGDVGSYGGQVIKTPHMDRLAAEGMRFSSAYSSAPICSPSRAGLLTGRYPLRSGIVQAMQAAGDSLERRVSLRAGMGMSNLGSIDMRGGPNMVNGLPQAELTIAELLQQADYRTAAFGKWHLGDFTQWQQYHPFKHGFDHFVGFNMSNDDWPVAFYRGKDKLLDDIGLQQSHYTKLFTDEAIEFIKKPSAEPFFIYLSHKDPHQPFFPSKQFAGKSAGGPYGDVVSEFDWSVGEIRKALEDQGLAENTLLIVTSDNGPWYEGSSGGLRGRKGQSYEGGFRVPMLAWWPDAIAAGITEDAPIMNIDFLPTVAALAGLSLPNDRTIDGKDISPLLFGDAHTFDDRALYFFHDYDVEAVRLGQWKYIASNSHYVWPNPLDKQDSMAGRMVSSRDYSPDGSEQSIATLGYWPLLYDLAGDPHEAYNVAKHHPAQRDEMAALLQGWKQQFLANPRAIKTINQDSSGL